MQARHARFFAQVHIARSVASQSDGRVTDQELLAFQNTTAAHQFRLKTKTFTRVWLSGRSHHIIYPPQGNPGIG